MNTDQTIKQLNNGHTQIEQWNLVGLPLDLREISLDPFSWYFFYTKKDYIKWLTKKRNYKDN
jgi:hypothetical protein